MLTEFNHKFAVGVENKTTGDSKLKDSPEVRSLCREIVVVQWFTYRVQYVQSKLRLDFHSISDSLIPFLVLDTFWFAQCTVGLALL